MSDFDDLLERLLLDPEFKAVLAADPDRVLAEYRLDPEQRRVLLTQVSTEAGTGLKVEERISKAGMAGLLSAFSEGAGGGMAQHTMQGVHTVAPTTMSAHGATISAGAIQHAIDTGAPASPPPPSMAGAVAALQEALDHLHQAQSGGMGSAPSHGSSQGAMQTALQNAINQALAAQTGGTSSHGSSQGAMANALQNLLHQMQAAQGGTGSQSSSQSAMQAAIQNAINQINAAQGGGHPAGSVADHAGGSGTQHVGPDLPDRWNAESKLQVQQVQAKGTGPTKVDDMFKGVAETKGHPGTFDQGGSAGQHYYDQHGRPITAQQAADLERHHQPVYHHVDAKGQPISDQAFNARYPHLDHYKSAYSQGTRFYDDHGTPLTPEQAAQYEAQHHHAPAEHLDAKGHPITNEQWAKYQTSHYPHLDHYKSAYAQGTRFYDDHGTPLTPEQAALYEAQHHHAPAEHLDAKGHPMTNEQWAKYVASHSPKGADVPGPSGSGTLPPTGVEHQQAR